MNKERMTPEIRFAGFIDDWEQHKLGNVVDILDGDRGKNYPSGNEFYENEHTLFLNASNVTKNGFSFKNNQFISEQKSNSLGNGKLKIDDIVLTSRGSLGHIAWYDSTIHKKISNARINSGMLLLRSTSKVTPSYITQYLKSPLGKKQIDFLSFGSAQPQLTKKDIVNYRIKIPSNMEQKIIGEFFLDFDNTIALQQQLLTDYKQLKKALLQQLFPQKGETIPKIRFAGFSNNWKLEKLGDVVEIRRGLTYKPNDVSSDGIRVLRSSNIKEDIFELRKDDVFVRENAINIPEVKNGDILITAANGSTRLVGKHAIINNLPSNTVHGGFMLVINSEYNPFINTWMSSSEYKRTLEFVQGGNGSIGNLSIKTLESANISIPSIEERMLIGKYFTKLESIIAFHQKKLETYQELKKALLQRMFV